MKKLEPASVIKWRRAVAIALPALMPLAMRAVFLGTINTFGRRRGYQAGFALYWAACWAGAAATIGPGPLVSMFRRSPRSLPAPRALSIAVLAFPAVGAVFTEFVPNLRRAGTKATVASVGIGLTNALAEEAFWRAVPVALFPDDPVRGWLWPAAGFTAWHLVALRAAGTGAGRASRLIFGAGLIGLGYGWVAFHTRSVVPTVGPHAITDASGVRVVKSMWLEA
jgi:membrane protease YdiL (CAAX protease family)